ncbi:Glycerol-1-phosphate dehydrogenase [NAD(P)+] [uncultured archaeon]|nr:Glycerol-1-phosphate dehydrogenase [NAD(P)+] [uncultured archaeon]
MKEMTLRAQSGTTRILLDAKLEDLSKHVPPKTQAVMVVDAEVLRLHGPRLPKLPVISIEATEDNKSLDTICKIYEFFMQQELDRTGFVIGIGGGIVCDMAGFAASTYMRGVPFAYAPTTLLAQADASLGGKTGVNLQGYKNQVGTFCQPSFVLMDLSVLKTLPGPQVRDGFAEIIKHAAIADAQLFEMLEKNAKDALVLDEKALRAILLRSLAVKISVVEKDEKEAGVRRLLNFGHTLGHAIEKTQQKSHGQAVAIGMVLAAKMSVERKMMKEGECKRLISLLRAYGLPTELDGRPDALLQAVTHDKKRAGASLHMVLLEKIGQAKVVAVQMDKLAGDLHDLR